MNIIPLQIVLIAGVLYGITSLIMELRRNKSKYKIGLYIAIIVLGIIGLSY